MSDTEEVTFSLEVMINKDKNKVLFAEADGHFADILVSFLTLPLGRILKLLEKHYGDEAPAIGSLTTLYRSLQNLQFWTEGAKLTLLNPTSSFELEYQSLKLDIYDFHSAEYFICSNHPSKRIRSTSLYYDLNQKCRYQEFLCKLNKVVAKKKRVSTSRDGVFTVHTASFIISEDLQILPNERGLLGIMSVLDFTETDEAHPMRVAVGFSEIMSLLKASLTSQTPLTDLILNKTRYMNSVVVESEHETSLDQTGNENDANPNSKKMILKLTVQKSTGKLLYAQAKDDFVEFLLSFLHLSLGGVENLLAGKTSIKAINNLYQSTAEFMHDESFKNPDIRNRLIKPNLPHGCISKDHILPLTEESLPADYNDLSCFSSSKFPKGQGSYLEGPRTYKVMDDLTVTPFSIVAILSSLNKLKIPISDVKEVQLEIGLKEALRILNVSLTSASALSDALLNHISNRQPNPEL